MEPIDVKFTDKEDGGCVWCMQFVPKEVGKPGKKEYDNSEGNEDFNDS